LIRTAREINDSKPSWVLDKLAAEVRAFSEAREGAEPTIAVLGLAFKPDIDDLRESPAVQIAKEICRAHGNKLLVVEPNINALPQLLNEASLTDLDEAVGAADIIVILVRHRSFAQLSYSGLRPEIRIIDAVGLLAQQSVPRAGVVRVAAE
jgi:UDP-N-acetyl-D-mannosaminuronic acid dehydrogenase